VAGGQWPVGRKSILGFTFLDSYQGIASAMP